jgi:gamma-glutamylcyclotransferase (GGCT)/AIG2-like uncharacterized protein YtfP
MFWWQQARAHIGHVNQALSHINAARDTSASSSATRTCELYFHALNRLWNSHAQHSNDTRRADTPAFIALVQTLLGTHDALLRDQRIQSLAVFTPEVLDHSTLNARGYRPGRRIGERDRRDATERHRNLRSALSRWMEDGSDAGRVLKKLAEFLYVIRSNIAHGEKTPYGPDLEKARRDEDVSSVATPALDAIVDGLLGWPSRRLVVYGTLKPGGSNAKVLEDIGGQWSPCRVPGRIQQVDGLPRFQWRPGDPDVDAMLLKSDGLLDRWRDLDRFEGKGYRRHLVSLTSNDQVWVANCYEAHESGEAG